MSRPRVGVVVTPAARRRYFSEESIERLGRIADVSWLPVEGGDREQAVPDDEASVSALSAFAADLDALVVSYGSPRVTESVMRAAPRLAFVGDTHGDRFGRRVDTEAAARRGIVVSDTTNGSSDPVAEWALALSLIGLRNAGAHFRQLIAGEILWEDRSVLLADPGYLNGELTGKTVGLIALGNVGRRLIELLRPFHVEILAYDPYAPDLLGSVYGVALAGLETLMARSDVVISLVPLTEATRCMIGAREIAALKPGAVFVNVSRGAVVDTEALVERLRTGDIVACLDVVEPEPLAADSPLRTLPNVFLSPHIAGVTDAAEYRFFDLMVDELRRVLDGYRPWYPLIPREHPVS